MNKSFIERIFPQSPTNLLPQYESTSHTSSQTSSPPRIALRDTSSSPSTRPGSSQKNLEKIPLAASIVHHNDRFLPVDRAAKSLQRTIQAYLDAQADGLNTSLGGDFADDISSVGSLTPTPSDVISSRSNAGIKTVPIRQPIPRKITLRGARKGLAKSMEDFAQLKEEELKMIRTESSARRNAVKQSRTFQAKKTALESQMKSIQQEDSSSDVATIRSEANTIEIEIRELEDRLLEMKARHRHLLEKAAQLENSIDSKLSSYKNSLALIEKDIKQFLKHPPISHSLANFDTSGSTIGGIYALKADRRTLQMAEEQWATEQDLLLKREESAETERRALHDGAKMWRHASKRINEFEKLLRFSLSQSQDNITSRMKQSNGRVGSIDADDPTASIIPSLAKLVSSIENDLQKAESQNWNLLICCLGAELEALQQARLLLQPSPEDEEHHDLNNRNMLDGEDTDGIPPSNLLRQMSISTGNEVHSPGAGSNHSLEDTLRDFGDVNKGKGPAKANSNDLDDPRELRQAEFKSRSNLSRAVDARSESEDDDPGPAFLLSN